MLLKLYASSPKEFIFMAGDDGMSDFPQREPRMVLVKVTPGISAGKYQDEPDSNKYFHTEGSVTRRPK